MSIEDVFEFFQNSDPAPYELFTCNGEEPSDADIADFEQQVGFRLPEEFREFTKSPLGGLHLVVREELWPRPKAFDVGPFWSFLYGLNVFGIAAGIPDWLDIRVQWQEFEKQGAGDLVPFFQ